MTTLFVANDGGHLQQLVALAPRLPHDEREVWLTNYSAQSGSLLEGREVHYVGHLQPRDVLGVARASIAARRLLRSTRPDLVISTGASLALSVLPLAALSGISAQYIESATRVAGPSATGKVLARVPRVELYTQYPAWAGGRWNYRGAVFDGFRAEPTQPRTAGGARPRMVVSLGTSRGYGFRRLVERVLEVAGGWDIYWQTGATDVTGLGIEGRDMVPQSEMRQAMADADVVVTHAGTGSAVAALECGHRPILVPRSVSRGEHVDDHQTDLAVELARRDLAVHRRVEDLTEDDLRAASGWTVRTHAAPAILLNRR